MRYPWIKRLLANDLLDSGRVMARFARDLLDRLAADGRALPLAWRVKETRGAIGFAEQRPVRSCPLGWCRSCG